MFLGIIIQFTVEFFKISRNGDRRVMSTDSVLAATAAVDATFSP
jgi:hypothetical protein